LGKRFPRDALPELSFELGCPNKSEIQFADAQLQFKTESFNYALPRITLDRIRIEHALENPKLSTEFCLNTVNYKLFANFQ
jgi:hypothetical protein